MRGRFETVDYSDEDSRPLLLSRVQGARPESNAATEPPADAPVDPAARPSSSKRDSVPDVPRLSLLMRFEREHERRFARARRKIALAITVAFGLGLGIGLAAQRPELRQYVVALAHATTR